MLILPDMLWISTPSCFCHIDRTTSLADGSRKARLWKRANLTSFKIKPTGAQVRISHTWPLYQNQILRVTFVHSHPYWKMMSITSLLWFYLCMVTDFKIATCRDASFWPFQMGSLLVTTKVIGERVRTGSEQKSWGHKTRGKLWSQQGRILIRRHSWGNGGHFRDNGWRWSRLRLRGRTSQGWTADGKYEVVLLLDLCLLADWYVKRVNKYYSYYAMLSLRSSIVIGTVVLHENVQQACRMKL